MAPLSPQAIALVLSCVSAVPTNSPPTAVIDCGSLVGTTTSLPLSTVVVNKFLGIPFAAPPKRFSLPAPVAKWTKPLNVSQSKPACIQQFEYPLQSQQFSESLFNTPAPQESEDCLYLNVFVPSTKAPVIGRAVMFWIYGGSLQFGDGSAPLYDGARIAGEEDVIMVTINYRTNAFGFPNSPELPLIGQNLGFLDQRYALDWVQRNIKSFGGDPKRVTIFGESSGASSVDAIITSMPKNPPFHAAILQSGVVPVADTNSTANWLTLVKLLNCTAGQKDIDCVKAAPAKTIKNLIEVNALSFEPVIDNVTLVKDPKGARAARNIATVPILAGTNGQEGRLFALGIPSLSGFINATFGSAPDLAGKISTAYAVGTGGAITEFDAIANLFTEYIFQCPAQLMVQEGVDVNIPSWRYLFNASFPNIQPVAAQGVDLKAYHTSEIALIFGTFPDSGATAQEIALGKFMRAAWAKFAKTPLLGPGWKPMTKAGGAELAVLGNNGGIGVTLIEPKTVDWRCPILAPALPAVGDA